MDCTITTSAGDVSQTAWDALVPDEGFYCSHAWLLSQEAATWASPAYAVVPHADSDNYLAAAVSYSFSNGGYQVPATVHDPSRAVLFGGRTGYHNELLYDRLMPAGARAMEVVVRAVVEHAARTGGAEVVLDFIPSQVVRWLAQRFNITVALRDLPAQIECDTWSLDSYLDRFSSRRQRRFRHEVRAFDAAGLTCDLVPLSTCAPDIAPLVTQTLHKYGAGIDVSGVEAFLAAQAATLGSRALALTCHRGSQLLGASVAFPWRNRLLMRVVGFDYDKLPGAFEYFNLAYYRPLMLSDIPARVLHLGPGSLLTKVRHGATPYPVWAAVLSSASLDGTPGLSLVHTDEAASMYAEASQVKISRDELISEIEGRDREGAAE